MTNPVATDVDLTAHYSAGTLLAHLRNPQDAAQEAAFHSQLGGLHNSGQIDLLALTASHEFNLLGKQDYFFVVQVFGGVIPLLDASVADVLEVANRGESLTDRQLHQGSDCARWQAYRDI